MTLRNSDGREVRLGTLWQQRSVVLVFVRHFGCMFCRAQVSELSAALPQIRARAAELVLIGTGDVQAAREFRSDFGLDVPVFADPELTTFRALPLQRGFKTVLTLSVMKRVVKTLQDGFRQGKTQGDVWQQGGVFVIGPGDRERYRYISAEAGDHPTIENILSVLTAAQCDPAPRRSERDMPAAPSADAPGAAEYAAAIAPVERHHRQPRAPQASGQSRPIRAQTSPSDAPC
ncbi:MAG: hypothetical protein Tsb0020_18190 [Haliangiales bacterium]